MHRKYHYNGEKQPKIVFVKPIQNSIYIKNHKIINYFYTIIVGNIDIIIDVVDDHYIEYVELYIDDQQVLKDYYYPYIYSWNEKIFDNREIRSIAYDEKGNYDTDEIIVWKFF